MLAKVVFTRLHQHRSILLYGRQVCLLFFLVLFHCDGFGQITWTVHIAATQYGNVIWQQLQWNHWENALQTVDSVRNLKCSLRILLGLFVVLFRYDDWIATSGYHLMVKELVWWEQKLFFSENVWELVFMFTYLLYGVHALWVDGIACNHHDHWHGLVNQSQWAVF